jgi:hypothetical protein
LLEDASTLITTYSNITTLELALNDLSIISDQFTQPSQINTLINEYSEIL